MNASRRYEWYVIALLSVVNVFNYMDRMALAVLMPAIKADLELSDGEIGLLVGFAFSLFYAICGLPIARWADGGIRRNIIAVALATWSVMTAVSGAAQHFWHLFLARVGVGAGEAGCLPPAQSILCDYVPLERRPAIFAIHGFGLYAGMMLGVMLAGRLGEAIGWRATFVVLGVPGIALAVVVRISLQEPVRGARDALPARTNGASLRETVAALWCCRTYRVLLVFTTLNGFVLFGLNQWWPSFYMRVHELGLSSMGISLGAAVGVGSAIGVLGGGFLGNKVAQRDVRYPLLISAASLALALPAALGCLFASSASYSILLAALTLLFFGVANGPVIATLYSVTRPHMRATAGAISIFFTSALGFGLGPFCVGLLSDLLTPSLGAQALRYALLAPVALLPALVIALHAAARGLPNDLSTESVKE